VVWAEIAKKQEEKKKAESEKAQSKKEHCSSDPRLPTPESLKSDAESKRKETK
jgi:hypothetical protein